VVLQDGIKVRSCDHRPRPKSCISIVIQQLVHDDVIMPLCVCKCEFYVNASAFS